MKNDLESLGRLRVQAILLLFVLFLAGALGGIALERAWLARPGERPIDEPRPAEPPARGLPPGLKAELHLTSEQEQRIEMILEANRPRTDAILDEFLPRLRSTVDSVRAEVRAVLTPQQQKIFDRRRPPLGPPLPGTEPPPHLRPRPGHPPAPGSRRGPHGDEGRP